MDECRTVEGHMAGCVQCQQRLAELEGQLATLERQLGGEMEPGPERVQAAKQKFMTWAREYEAELEKRSQPRKWFVPPSWLKLAGMSVSALVLLGVAIRWYFPPALPAETVLVGIRQVEGRLLEPGVAVRQLYEVETRQLKPVERVKRSRLEVLNSRSDGKYAVRWQTADGQLQFAVWHPAAGQAYAYDRLQRGAVAYHAEVPAIRRLSEVAEDGPELEQLESRLMRWLASRQWQPVRLGEEWAEFSSEPGVRLQVESTTSETGEKRFRLTAYRIRGGNQVTLMLEVGAGDYRPRLELVRVEQGNRAAEVWLRTASEERVVAAQLQASVFEPEVPVIASNRPEETRLVPEKATSRSELMSAEMEAHYALHRVKACLGEPVEVKVEADQVWVRGLVETQERRNEIEGALRKLPLVQNAIQLFPEIPEGKAAVRKNSMKEIRMPEVQGGQWPWREQLERYATEHPEILVGLPGSGVARERLTEAANNSLNQAQAALTEAWALRRLAERFPKEKTVRLLPRSLWLLEIMVKDHETELQKQLQSCRQVLGPLLHFMAQTEKAARFERQVDASGAEPANSSNDWASASLQVFSTVQRFQRKLSEVLATATIRDNDRSNNPQEILELLSELEIRYSQLTTQTEKAFTVAKAKSN
jgi:hypothetical protein